MPEGKTRRRPATRKASSSRSRSAADDVAAEEVGDLMDGDPLFMSLDAMLKARTREFILMAGPDGSGKTSAILSIARFIEDEELNYTNSLNMDADVFIIDTENGLIKILQGLPEDARPSNIVAYYRCANAKDVLLAFARCVQGTETGPLKADKEAERHPKLKPGDWLMFESMGKFWEFVQDLGYLAVTGQTKTDYINSTGRRTKTITPHPDQLWSIAKRAHDGEFLNIVTDWPDINVVFTSPRGKIRDPNSRFKSAQREEVGNELGIDANIEGLPRLPYYPDTVLMFGKRRKAGEVQILKDRTKPGRGQERIPVPTAPEFALEFFEYYRDNGVHDDAVMDAIEAREKAKKERKD